jgi:hypothetical protein
MPDIILCTNEDCPLKEKCYRWTAEPDEHQSFAEFIPDKDEDCEYFIEI